MQQPDHRAQPPRPPAHTPASQRAQDEQDKYLAERESIERRSVLRGLLLLALVALAASIVRAGLHRGFMPGWWRPW